MELKEILAISGQPGLYKYVAQSSRGVIVESLSDGKRMNAASNSKVSALTEISIFTEGEDIPLAEVFTKIYEHTQGQPAISHKEAPEKLKAYFAEVLPEYDRDRVHVSDMKKCCLFIGNTQYTNVYIREARMWNRALTDGEIIDKEYLPQDPTDPNLIMYMPFNTVENNEMKELTGNWEISDFRTLGIWDEDPPKISYVENVQFPAEDLIIVE